MKPSTHFVLLIFACLAASLAGRIRAQEARRAPQYRFGNSSIPGATENEPLAAEFSSDAARNYLEVGVSLWSRQKKCVSCHTHGIYLITRPALSSYWGKPPEELRRFVVAESREAMEGNKTNGSTPAQLAYIARGLAEWDAHIGGVTSVETDTILRCLLRLQSADGSIRPQYRWPPLNSDTWHATIMAAMAIATAPGWRSNLKDAKLLARIEKLEEYLREAHCKHDHQRLLLLWASTRSPSLLSSKRREEILRMIWSQQRKDGGWSIRTFAEAEELGRGPKVEK